MRQNLTSDDKLTLLEDLKRAINYYQSGKLQEAKETFTRVIENDPLNDIALYFQGLTLAQMKDFSSAVNFIRRAVEIKPCYDYLNTLADIYLLHSLFNEAAECLEMATKLDSVNFQLYVKLANTYFSAEKYTESIDTYKNALKINPDSANIYYNMGVIFNRIGQTEESIVSYINAIKLNPNYAEAYYNLGILYKNQNNINDALNCYLKAKDLNFSHSGLFLNIGNIYISLLQYKESIPYLEKAVELRQDYAEAYNSLGIAFHKTDKLPEAYNAYQKALDINPSSALTYNNLGRLCLDMNQIENAFNYFNKGLSVNPDSAECKYNLGAAQLLLGNYEQGWENYEYRFFVEEEHPTLLHFPQPRWQGESLEGKSIYVYYEQGFGDTIMFSRYISSLTSSGAKVFFKPQESLIGIFNENNFGAQILTGSAVSPLIDFDYHTPLLSLPGILKANAENIPFGGDSYLRANPEKINSYKEKYFNNNNLKIGIFWQGNPKGFKNRAIPLNKLYDLFKINNTKIYSFQKGFGQEQLNDIPDEFKITDLGSTFEDFSDTAAALSNLDLLITIDSAIVHLAGALGINTCIMIPAVPEWRWQLETNHTHWYNSVKLYRQSQIGQWDDVVEKIVNDIQEKLI